MVFQPLLSVERHKQTVIIDSHVLLISKILTREPLKTIQKLQPVKSLDARLLSGMRVRKHILLFLQESAYKMVSSSLLGTIKGLGLRNFKFLYKVGCQLRYVFNALLYPHQSKDSFLGLLSPSWPLVRRDTCVIFLSYIGLSSEIFFLPHCLFVSKSVAVCSSVSIFASFSQVVSKLPSCYILIF